MHRATVFPLLSLVALAACATPQQRCINGATAEVRNLQSMLTAVNGNLARGYAYQSYEVPVMDWEMCGYDTFPGRHGEIIQRPRMCPVTDTVTRQRSVPIDPAAEARKRDALIARIAALQPQMNAQIAACNATYGTPAPVAVPVAAPVTEPPVTARR